MGEFQAGKWILGLSIYFFAYFLILLAITNLAIAHGVDHSGITANDPGFGVYSGNTSYSGGSASDTVSINPIRETIGFMFTFQNNVFINSGSQFQFVFMFFFTYIPLFVLIFSLYMILPFAH